MTRYEFWSLIIQGIVGAGTLIVAIIAIWGALVRSWLFGPKLKVSLLNPKGEINPLSDGTQVRYYHLKVTNNRKRAPAQNVRVLLTKIFQLAADGGLVDRSLVVHFNLPGSFRRSTHGFRSSALTTYLISALS